MTNDQWTSACSGLRRNIELKARYAEFGQAVEAIARLGGRFEGRMRHVDTYFRAAHGRLKLREIEAGASAPAAELIWYRRADAAEFRGSDYVVAPVGEPALMKQALAAAWGVRGRVAKVRDLYMYCNVRIHLDSVEGLGRFVEFEAVIDPANDEPTSRARLDELHAALAIRDEDHCARSYADLLGLSE